MAKTATNETTEAPVDVLDILAEQEVYYELGEGDDRLVLVQKPLTFFGKIEFFSVVGKAVQRILIDGGSLSEILDTPEYDSTKPIQSQVTDADVFVKALTKIVEAAPELMSDLYLVILNVPKGQREYYALRLEELSDDQGMQILDVFIDQNWEVMVSFFSEKMLPLFNKISKKVQA
jgi:hypothetical protein